MRRFVIGMALALGACQDAGPELSTTSQAVVSVGPPSKNFGSVQVGQASAPTTFTITPGPGENYDDVTSVTESCPDFSVNAPGLPTYVYRICDYTCGEYLCRAICNTLDYQTYSFTATFQPTVAGTVSCVVNIVISGTTRTVTLSGTGTVPPIDIVVQPTSIAFGDVRRNTASTPVGITVRNAGSQTMTVSSVSVSSGFQIVTGPTSSYTVASGATQAYSVTCNPSSVGTLNGSFIVNSNDPSTPTVSVPLSCRGIDSNLTLSPSPTTIATTRVGEPVEATINLQNSGAASMQLQSVSLSGTDLELMSAPSPGTYGTGAVGTARVRFAAVESGERSGTLTVTYDNGQTRTSQITARALATSMALSPDGDVSFGPVCAGHAKEQTFTVIANDEGPFEITGLGGTAPPFTVTAPTLPVSVAGAGASMLTFTVEAAPTEPGLQTSALEVVTDIPNTSPRMINLTVDALVAGVSPSPTAIDFGSMPINTTTFGQAVHLSNCTDAPVTITNAYIEGPDAGEFAIVATPDNLAIPPAGLASYLVVLSTNTGGLKSADLVIEYGDGEVARVALAGEGLDELLDPDGDGDGPKSPYADRGMWLCSAAQPHAWWPFALAFVIVLGRRRRAISR